MNGTRRIFLVTLSVLLLLAVALPRYGTGAAEPELSGAGALQAKYPAIAAKLHKNQFGAPIYLESTEKKGSLVVDMYGVVYHPFEAVAASLESASNWCDITSLHINIKACIASKSGNQSYLTLYSGRKYYQPPSDAYPLKLKFLVAAQQPDYLDVVLAADDGPLHTKNHRIRLEAAPLDRSRTFVHFTCAYSHGPFASMAIKTYFSTIASGKVGFSIIGSKSGAPVYIGGVRGAVERNAVRYYLALQVYLDTLKVPETQRFEQRISRWYDVTARYPRQLKEVEKPEYLANKRREHQNQLLLQKKEARYPAPSVLARFQTDVTPTGAAACTGRRPKQRPPRLSTITGQGGKCQCCHEQF